MGGAPPDDDGGGGDVEDEAEDEVHSGVAEVAAAGEGSWPPPSAAVEEPRRGGQQTTGRQWDPLRRSRVSCCTCTRAAGCDAASKSRNMVAARGPAASDGGRVPDAARDVRHEDRCQSRSSRRAVGAEALDERRLAALELSLVCGEALSWSPHV